MPDQPNEPNLDDTLTKSQVEVLRSKAAKAADQPLLTYADELTARLAALREKNHWAEAIKRNWRNQESLGE